MQDVSTHVLASVFVWNLKLSLQKCLQNILRSPVKDSCIINGSTAAQLNSCATPALSLMHAEHTIYKYAVVVPGGLSSLTSVSTSDFSAAFRVANARSASRFLAASCVRTCRHVGDSSQLLASSWKAPDLRNAALWNAPPEQAHVLHCLFIVFLGICLFSLGNCHFFLDILVFQQAHALLTQSAWTDPAIAAERRMPTYQSFSEHRCFPHCFFW